MSFERLERTQPVIARNLRRELGEGLIAQSMLFSGPAYSSRMTAALELSLELIGARDEFYTLNTPSLLILSDRDSELRVNAAMGLYRKQRNQRSLRLLVQTARIFLLSCHAAVSQGMPTEVLKAASEASDALYSAKEGMDEKAGDAFLSVLGKNIGTILKKKGKAPFTIDQVRQASEFMQYEGEGAKVVILENIENVAVGTMNSILKILEEPPKNSYLILISESPERILDTILSRVRKYSFPEIAPDAEVSFLRDELMCYDKDISSIREFMMSSSGLDIGRVRKEAKDFATENVLGHKPYDTERLTALAKFLDESKCHDLFFDEVVKEIREMDIKPHDALKAFRLMSHLKQDMDVFNQNKRIVLERLTRGLAHD